VARLLLANFDQLLQSDVLQFVCVGNELCDDRVVQARSAALVGKPLRELVDECLRPVALQ
jgi:hypothetical protein